ncbi:hypothetical protein Plhal304r1_c056g0141821 [Plasmopara halstedii]
MYRKPNGYRICLWHLQCLSMLLLIAARHEYVHVISQSIRFKNDFAKPGNTKSRIKCPGLSASTFRENVVLFVLGPMRYNPKHSFPVSCFEPTKI